MGFFDNFVKKNNDIFDGVEDGPYDPYDDAELASDVVDEPVEAAPAEPAPAAPTFTPANPVSLKLITPKTYDDAKEITDYLMNGNTILLNLESANRELVVRIIDYLRGAIQVVGGMMTKVGKAMIVVAPKNVDVSSIESMVGKTEE